MNKIGLFSQQTQVHVTHSYPSWGLDWSNWWWLIRLQSTDTSFSALCSGQSKTPNRLPAHSSSVCNVMKKARHEDELYFKICFQLSRHSRHWVLSNRQPWSTNQEDFRIWKKQINPKWNERKQIFAVWTILLWVWRCWLGCSLQSQISAISEYASGCWPWRMQCYLERRLQTSNQTNSKRGPNWSELAIP